MVTYIITRCPRCGKKFGRRPEMFPRVYGPRQVRCGQCGYILTTNLEPWKAKPLRDRIQMIAIRVGLILLTILLVPFLGEMLIPYITGSGSNWLVVIQIGSILVGGFLSFSLIYTLIDFIGSDGTPTW